MQTFLMEKKGIKRIKEIKGKKEGRRWGGGGGEKEGGKGEEGGRAAQ